MSKKKKIEKNKEKLVKSINNNIRSSVRKLNPILKNIVGKSISNEFGKWKFKILKSELINRNITILTKIKGEEISLPLSQVALNEFIDSDYENLETKKIIVQPGNSLWRIARKNLGGGIFYSEIYKNNLKRIKNPDLIYPGQVFNIPDTKRKMLYE